MKHKALSYFVIFSLFRSIDILLGKWIYSQGVDPWDWIIQVYIFTIIIWSGYVFITQGSQPIHIIKKAIWPFLVVSLTAAGAIAAAYIGLSKTDAINYSFLIQTAAIFTVVFAHIRFADEKISWHTAGLMVLFFLGVYFVSTNGQTMRFHSGDGYVLLAAGLFGVNNITIKECLRSGLQVPMMVLGRNIATFLMGLILLCSIGIGSIAWERRPYALVSAFLVCIWIYALNKVVEYSSPSYLVMMSMTNPILVILGASIRLGESMSLIQIIGGVIIIGSGVVLEWVRRHNS